MERTDDAISAKRIHCESNVTLKSITVVPLTRHGIEGSLYRFHLKIHGNLLLRGSFPRLNDDLGIEECHNIGSPGSRNAEGTKDFWISGIATIAHFFFSLRIFPLIDHE